MRIIGKLSAVFTTAVATLALSAAAASAATTTTSVSAAAPDTTCSVVGSGSPGYTTFTLHVNKDTCGQTVKAAV
ncbi:MAG TPA: hypothetical protein VGD68_02440, partial [Streptosporangiaceae bacterium]